jgi:phosphoribosylformylglycinamidine synthase
MTAYEMMLQPGTDADGSTQTGLEAEARAVFEKMGPRLAIVGETIAEDRFMEHNGEIKADLPLAALSGSAPEYDRQQICQP